MWFKQIQVFQLTNLSCYAAEKMLEKLEPLRFTPCLPSMPSSIGWVPLLDEEGAPLTRTFNGYTMLCLQIEDKILPATVVNQTLSEKIKQIELNEARKVRQKEKLSLKDELIITLLPRAFTKLTRIYAYLDTKNRWLVLGSASPKKAEQFISLLKKSFNDEIQPIEVTKPAAIMTSWLKHQHYPASFSIEKKACVLQDPQQENRIIRCQQQDLFANSVQSFIKDGCEAIQVALCWQDRVHFVLSNDFSLRSIQFEEEIVAQTKDIAETKQQQFDADFIMMTETFSGLLTELLALFTTNNIVPIAKQA
ncbi:MAG: recombination-associated protein RdgC [Gammaproteobacteria bacterium]|nr:MAG: recombination-associated protein RdgC [Gammaproteobacteria bacterium]